MGEEFEPVINHIKSNISSVKQCITVNKNPHDTGEYQRLFYTQPDSEPRIEVELDDESFII